MDVNYDFLERPSVCILHIKFAIMERKKNVAVKNFPKIIGSSEKKRHSTVLKHKLNFISVYVKDRKFQALCWTISL